MKRCHEIPLYQNVTSTLIASRQQLCVNKKIKREAESNNAQLIASCKKLVKTHACYFKSQVDSSLDSILSSRGVDTGKQKKSIPKPSTKLENLVPDIEDLLKQSACPYYAKFFNFINDYNNKFLSFSKFFLSHPRVGKTQQNNIFTLQLSLRHKSKRVDENR